jgi:diguanylate cyclase (GGDEF)-like protein/PAS domain S-box-containing protein
VIDPGNIADFSDILVSALEGSGTGLWDRNVVTGEIRYSQAWLAILGEPNSASVTHIEQAYLRVHPDDLARVQQAMQAHFDQRTAIYEIEHRLRSQDGNYKWVLSRGKVISRDADGGALRMVGTTTDITYLRSLTEKLADQSHALQAAHRLARIGAWRWDLAQKALQFSGEIWWLFDQPVTTDWVSFAKMRERFHPDDYDHAMTIFNKILKNQEPVTLEYRVVHPSGSIHSVLTHAEPVFAPDGSVKEVRGTSQDITPYRKIEAALRDSEDHYRHMVELHPQIPWTAGANGGILEVGPQWFELTGLSREQTMPFGWIDAVVPVDREHTISIWRRCVAEKTLLDTEFRIMRREGGIGWFRTRAAPRLNKTGEVIRWYGTLDEVTDRHEAEAARNASEAMALRVLETTSDGVIMLDRAAVVTFANKKAGAMLQQPGKLVGRHASEIFGDGCPPMSDALKRGKLPSGHELTLDFELRSLGIWLEATISGGETDISVFIRDVSAKRRADAQIQYAARHDHLTGTLNRTEFFTQLATRVEGLPLCGCVTLLCLDLDYFKDINDSFGHPVGDQVLCKIAKRLKEFLCEEDLVCRVGGDEFLIARVDYHESPAPEPFASAISEVVKKSVVLDYQMVAVSASIGVAVEYVEPHNVEQVYRHADLALYEAKRHVKGGFVCFRPVMESRISKAKTIHSELIQALERREFYLAFQPIFYTASRRTAGAEALLRWRRPGGIISPSEFVPAAEESGLICDIGSWVIQEACQAACRWPVNLVVSVNVSARQFELNNIQTTVRSALAQSGLDPRRLKLEITESVLIDGNSYNLQQLQALRDLGVKIVLDDFGTGYSSLSYLENFRFDFIKIDRSFISKIKNPDEKHPVLDAIVGMTKALNLPTTAEGVETEVQFEHVRSLGCGFVQGFLLGRPGSEEELLAGNDINSARAIAS